MIHEAGECDLLLGAVNSSLLLLKLSEAGFKLGPDLRLEILHLQMVLDLLNVLLDVIAIAIVGHHLVVTIVVGGHYHQFHYHQLIINCEQKWSCKDLIKSKTKHSEPRTFHVVLAQTRPNTCSALIAGLLFLFCSMDGIMIG